jgi:hypothetical protein
MLKPEGTCRVSSQLCLSREVATLPQDGLNEGATRRIEMTGPAGCTMAETRIVECIPQGVGAAAKEGPRKANEGRHPCRRFEASCFDQGGSLPPPWTPASLSLLPWFGPERVRAD